MIYRGVQITEVFRGYPDTPEYFPGGGFVTLLSKHQGSNGATVVFATRWDKFSMRHDDEYRSSAYSQHVTRYLKRFE